MDLVIMAAGLGSRFGGLKQLEPVDFENNFLIDYSIFDAIRAGFNHIVFIIKEDFYEDFKTTIGHRIEKFIDVDYVFQDTNNIPSAFNIPISRTKPFGTAHAILCAKDKIRSDFAVINADDFYGLDAFEVAFDYLTKNNDENQYALIAYEAINTISDQGAVKRGICYNHNNYLTNIVESSIEKQQNGTLLATPLNSNISNYPISYNQLVSMNLFAFTKKFLTFLDDLFITFLNENKENLSSCEFFLPTAVSTLINNKISSVKVLKTTSKWFGITYKQDLDIVKSEIKNMKQKNQYPQNLWS